MRSVRNREALRHARDDRGPLKESISAILNQEYGEPPRAATVDKVIRAVEDFMRYGDTDGDYFD